MSKTLIITEKPSVGRDIARVLGVRGKGEGYLFGGEYIVSWAVGHLLTLCEPDDYNPRLKRWNVHDLPILPEQIRTKPIAKTEAQLKVLIKLIKQADVNSLICATDSGREGELIFRYIYAYAGSAKPVKRLWISSMTDDAIRAGFQNLRPMSDYDFLYYSALCRSHSDWLVGINASRAYSIRHDANLPVGRVQTPTLAMIVTRQKEIDSFVPEDYWEVHVDLSANAGAFLGKWFEPAKKIDRLDSKEKAAEIVKKVKGKAGAVDSIENTRKSAPPPLLHDLADLQREANKKFGFAAAKTLNVAQSLYEKHKAITYPRTDSRHLPPDIKLAPIVSNLIRQASFSQLAISNYQLSIRFVDASKVTDHHAIIPTDRMPKGLTSDEAKIYDLVARRFLAAFHTAHVQDVTQVVTKVCGECFLSKGTVLVELGWKVLYTGEKNEDKDSQNLPNLKQGDEVKVVKASSKAKKTTPPKPYTEATLLSAMENCGRMVENEELAAHLKGTGLGTAATRAATIERLLQVEYIVRKGKALAPTDKGKMLIGVLPTEITSPETTGRWEKGLHSINQGKMHPDRFMGSIHKFVNYLVSHSKGVPSRGN